jgi:hypothetical protein
VVVVADQSAYRIASGHAVLVGRRLLTCSICGWVHYAMTAEEKQAHDRLPDRYEFTPAERRMYETTFRQCLRCESPAAAFRIAGENDLARAEGHIVTPVYIEPDAGTN